MKCINLFKLNVTEKADPRFRIGLKVSLLGVVSDSFCLGKLIKSNNGVKGWFNTGGSNYDFVIRSSWCDTWVMVYFIPYNASGPGGCGLIHYGERMWSIVTNHFDNCGVSIYTTGDNACVKVGMGAALIEVTGLYSHWASNTTVDIQYNVDVSGWTLLYPTT